MLASPARSRLHFFRSDLVVLISAPNSLLYSLHLQNNSVALAISMDVKKLQNLHSKALSQIKPVPHVTRNNTIDNTAGTVVTTSTINFAGPHHHLSLPTSTYSAVVSSNNSIACNAINMLQGAPKQSNQSGRASQVPYCHCMDDVPFSKISDPLHFRQKLSPQ